MDSTRFGPSGKGSGPEFSGSPDGLRQRALELYERFGWSLIPVIGKRAVAQWKHYQEERPTRRELERLFADPRITGIAVVHGPVSGGLVIRDFDSEDSYPEWAENHKETSSKLPTARTARGAHVYFRGPSYFYKLPDGEYRGTGRQYTLIPPSLHPSGRLYEWLIPPDRDIPLLSDPSSAGLLSIPLKGGINSEGEVNIYSFSTSPHPPPTNRINPSEVANSPSTLPAPERIGGHYHGWRPSWKVRQLARIHQPSHIGERNSRILDYVRSLQRLDVKWDTFRAKVAFRQWWGDAWQVVGTKDEDFSLQQFYDAWRYCPEQPPTLDYERLLRSSAGESLPPVAGGYPQKTQTLLKACIHLQRYHCGGPFFLSCQDAGRLMGRSKETGQLVLRTLVRDGLLERLSKGNNLSGKASRYRCAWL